MAAATQTQTLEQLLSKAERGSFIEYTFNEETTKLLKPNWQSKIFRRVAGKITHGKDSKSEIRLYPTQTIPSSYSYMTKNDVRVNVKFEMKWAYKGDKLNGLGSTPMPVYIISQHPAGGLFDQEFITITNKYPEFYEYLKFSPHNQDNPYIKETELSRSFTFSVYDTIEEQKKKVRTNLFFADVIAKIALLDDNQARTVASSIEAASGFTVNCNSKSYDINEVKSGLIDVAHSSISYFQTAPYFNDATSNGSLMTELDVYHLIGLATKKGVTTMTTEVVGDDTINVFRFTESVAALDMDVQKDPIICKFQKENNNPFYMQVGEYLKREFKKDNNQTFIKMSMWTDSLNKTIPIGEWHPSVDRKRLNPFVKSLLEQHPTEKVVPAKVV